MKAIKYILIASAAALVGCSNFFDTTSVSTMDASEVFVSPTRTAQAIAGVYELFGENNSYRNRIACGYTGMNTDTEWNTRSTNTDANVSALFTYNMELSNSQVSSTTGSDIWSYLNAGIERCNEIIEGIEKYADKNAKEYKEQQYLLGEAYFLRAFLCLEQVKYWGDVPARFVSLSQDMNGLNTKKGDRNLVYEQIRADLKKAAVLMPFSAEIPVLAAKNNVGRASRTAALALLARADLMYAGKAVRPNSIDDPTGYSVTYNIADESKRKDIYKEALLACDSIFQGKEKELAANFETPFRQICQDVSDYAIMEHIWVLPFANGSRGQVLNYNAPKIPSESATTVSRVISGYGDGASSNGSICVVPSLVYSYDAADKRRDVTVVPGQWYYNNGSSEEADSLSRTYIFGTGDTTALLLYQKHSPINNLFCGKFRWEWMNRKVTTTDDGIDFPILRYADVLLMFAEAALEVGNAGCQKTGAEALSEVRLRAGLEAVTSYTLDDIKNERAKEFVGEYIRKYDLMRWGILKQQMVATHEILNKMAGAKEIEHDRAGLQMNDSIYYKYRFDAELGGYVMDSIWGMRFGETGKPATFSVENGWRKKGIIMSESKGYFLSDINFPMYASEEKLESRQYWPIFSTNVATSGQTLWNNYGY